MSHPGRPVQALVVFGTRPEAIKLCPLIEDLRSRISEFSARVCVTAQHRSMLDQVLRVFGVRPDHDLDIMRSAQSLGGTTARVLESLDPVLQQENPDVLVVQGDTTTAFAAALAGFYRRIPVAHVEAGLRTGNLDEPFPEEANRLLISKIASLHFAPTQRSAENLRAEGIAEDRIFVTGNTGIDAVKQVAGLLENGSLMAQAHVKLDANKNLVLVTAHRRESFGAGFESICRALLQIAGRPDTQVVYPVHHNPNVQEPVRRLLGGHPNILLCEPLDYLNFVDLMRRATLLLTDSGGIQEEGPALGKPVVVMRDTTERPEAIEAGTAVLTGTGESRIVEQVNHLLDDPAERLSMSLIHNPFGDGHASARISTLIYSFISNL